MTIIIDIEKLKKIHYGNNKSSYRKVQFLTFIAVLTIVLTKHKNKTIRYAN
jgi:hypothetical protein